MLKRFSKFLFVFALFSIFSSGVKSADISVVPPQELGFDPGALRWIDSAVDQALAEKKMPGCVVCIGRNGKIGFLKAYGVKQIATDTIAEQLMNVDTVFDLASLTKPVATATAVMILVDEGKIEIDVPVSKYMSEFQTPEKEKITVRQLMLHTAGFIPDNHIRDYEDGAKKARERFLALDPQTLPGEKFRYSDVSFQVLGELIERVSGKTVAQFSEERIFKPLGMNETKFNPDETLSRRAAPTQDRELGKVHDPRALLTDGYAGHAGLFSTAKDLAVYSSMMLNMGRHRQTTDETQILKSKTVSEMTAHNVIPGGYRALGWDKRSAFSGNRGDLMTPQAYGHSGFTGTSLWIDPGFDMFVIFLSNRVHPDGKGSVNPLAKKIGSIAVDAILSSPEMAPFERDKCKDTEKRIVQNVRKNIEHYRQVAEKSGIRDVLPGIDLLQYDHFAALRGKKVGLISNHTGVNKAGVSTAKLLHESKDVELVALFGPEHGFTGAHDRDGIEDGTDPDTGVKVYSLYGATRRPTPQMLENVDILLFDMQDIGARFYTYTSTMGAAMESAAEKGIPFMVLDRPNPIRGDRFEGFLTQPGAETFVGWHRIPIRHGLTLGELALLFAVDRRLDVDLIVVPTSLWKRDMDFVATALPWVNPSPNMRSLTAAYLYPGIGLWEFTNLSVGRGTETPFEHIGAPWIDSEKLLAALKINAEKANLQGVRFEATQFTPDASKFANEKCQGIRFVLDDAATLNSVTLGLVLAHTLRSECPENWETKNINTLLLSDEVKDDILAGKDRFPYRNDQEQFFRNRIAPLLLY